MPGEDNKVRQIVDMICGNLAPLLVRSLAEGAGPAIAQKVAQNLAPNLAQLLQTPLTVERVSPETEELEQVQTTFPQILAELTDAIYDLIEIMEEQSKSARAPRRKKKAGG